MSDEKLQVNRDFKGIWIPREVWLAEGLAPNEKILWAEIHSLHNQEKGGCYASNDYLCQFIGVKERRLQEMISNLKAYGLIVQVSFDGRERVIKAVMPPEGFVARRAEVQKSAPLGCRKVHLSDAEKCTPLLYIDNKEDNKEDISPPIPPFLPAAPDAAKAAEKKVKSSSKKVMKKLQDISPDIKIAVEKMAIALKSANHDWKIPKNFHAMMAQVDEMIEEDGRTLERIIEVFMWCLRDPIWLPCISTPNPFKYLSMKFGQIGPRVNCKLISRKPEEVDRRQRDSDGNVVDAYKDDLF